MAGLDGREGLDDFLRVAAPAAVLYSAIWAFVQVGVVGQLPGTGQEAGIAALATAAYLPFYLRHVLAAVHGRQPHRSGWTIAAMSAVVVGATPLIGPDWLPTYHVIAVSALLTLRPRWAWAISSMVVLAQVPLAASLESPIPAAGSYYAVTVLWRASSVFVPVWLVGAAGQLAATRRELAEQAVVRERLRVDTELRRTIGATLSAIVSRGESAARLEDGRAAAHEVQLLVDDSRLALAEARGLMTGYQRASLTTELDTAVILLQAAGVDARVELDDEVAGAQAIDDDARSELRSVVARVLCDRHESDYVIRVAKRGGGLHFDASTHTREATDGQLAGP